MKKWILGMVLLVVFSANTAFGQSSFKSPEDVKHDIGKYYNERLRKLNASIYLLEIMNSEKDSNFMYVYFMDKDPYIKKDLNGNIDSGETRVMIAVYTYSHLKFAWRLFKIRQAKEGLVFEVD